DDPPRAFQLHPGLDEHVTNFNFAGLTGSLVGFEIFREALLEHQRDPLPHHAYGVDRIRHGIHGSFQKVTLGESHHRKYQFGRALTSSVTPAWATRPATTFLASSLWQATPIR